MLVYIKYKVHFASLGKDSFDESKRMEEANSLGNQSSHGNTGGMVWY